MLCHSGYSHCLPQSVHIMLINCRILFHPASARSAVCILRDRQRTTLNIVTQLDRTTCGVPFKTLRQISISLSLYIHFQLTPHVYSGTKCNGFVLKVAREEVE